MEISADFIAGLKKAERIALEEADYAKKEEQYNLSSRRRTEVRRITAERIAAAIRMAMHPNALRRSLEENEKINSGLGHFEYQIELPLSILAPSAA